MSETVKSVLQATGHLTQGKLQMVNRQAFTDSLRQMEDGDVLVTVAPALACRSQQQNAYYWSVINQIADYTGELPQAVHDYCKHKFLSRPVVLQNTTTGEVEEQQVPVSTRTLSQSGFFDYTEQVRMWAAEFLSVACPTPSPRIQSKPRG